MNINATLYPHVSKIYEVFLKNFPYFKATIPRQIDLFGESWLAHFQHEMQVHFADDENAITNAALGYGKFCLDSMKLQKIFDKTRQYENKTYEEAASEVYQNRDYMFSLYLPGILLSHFLWSHHYKQHIFFREKFVPKVIDHGGHVFYDIGVGTGFYSKEMLLVNENMHGEGFDLSPHSLEYTKKTLEKFNLEEKYTPNKRNIISEPIKVAASFITCIEVLEHLENPQEFLNSLSKMLEPGGFGLISAALTAPNADHIYLYEEPEEVADQLGKANLDIIEYIHDPAYEPRKPSDSIPRNVAFIVTPKG